MNFQNLIPFLRINTLMELICFLVALYTLNKEPNIWWKGMILFLGITSSTELLGFQLKLYYLKDPLHHLPNLWIYNLLLIFQILFISFLFEVIFRPYVRFYFLRNFGISVLGAIYLFETLEHGIFQYHKITNIISSLIWIIYGVMFYYYLLKEEYYIDLKTYSSFWWVAGILFFNFGTTVANISFPYLVRIKLGPHKFLSYYIYNILIIILYSAWSYAFICRKWEIMKLNGSS